MDPERWKRVEDLFQEALERDPNEIETFPEHACADDPELRRDVAALLEAHERAGKFLEPGGSAGSPHASHEDDATQGRLIGPYRVVREIGHGGGREAPRNESRAMDLLFESGQHHHQLVGPTLEIGERYERRKEMCSLHDEARILRQRAIDDGTNADTNARRLFVEGRQDWIFVLADRTAATYRCRLEARPVETLGIL